MFQPNHKKKSSIKFLLESYMKLLLGQTWEILNFIFWNNRKNPKCKRQYQNEKIDPENIL